MKGQRENGIRLNEADIAAWATNQATKIDPGLALMERDGIAERQVRHFTLSLSIRPARQPPAGNQSLVRWRRRRRESPIRRLGSRYA